MQATDILNVIGRPNAYYPRLAKYFGGVNSAVLFSQLFYWQGKATSELGVYKTRDELEEETGLTHNEQRTAIKKLVDQGVLIVTEKRLQHKTYYKIDNDVVNQILSNFATSDNSIPPDSEYQRPDLDNVETETSTESSSLDQEITSVITSKITNNLLSKKSQSKKASQLPDDFQPNEHHREIAYSEHVNLETEFIKFKDYCLANGKKYVDWSAGFNNWLRNAGKYAREKSKNSGGFKSLAERNREILESMRG